MTTNFDNSYARLPDAFHVRVAPAVAPAPAFVRVNARLAVAMGIDADWLAGPGGLDMLSGRVVVPGSDPVACAYAGHQFGNFVPQLGDGRAVLLGEIVGPDGVRRDLQLKGGGRTPWSRGGDGRAALGPVLREYLVSEAMAALGVPTTRALAALTTGEPVFRDTMLPGAVIARVATSHIRVGTFQYFAARGDTANLRVLADHAIARHYPEAANTARPYDAFLRGVIARQADLVARWLNVGFIHGVMNTDNCAVSGETIDYGPCAFMDTYDPATVFSSIDRQGRYAYGNQPRMAQWNLTRLAEALLPLLADEQDAAIDEAQDALTGFVPAFEGHYHEGLRTKFGLVLPRDEDIDLINACFALMAEDGVDFTTFFRALGSAAAGEDADVRALFTDVAGWNAWAARWQARLADEPRDATERRAAMDAVSPAYVPRNHLVEEMIVAAVERSDYAPFEALLDHVTYPYEERAGSERYAAGPKAHERVQATYCGT